MEPFTYGIPDSTSRGYFTDFENTQSQTPELITWDPQPKLPKTLEKLLIVEGFAASKIFEHSVLCNAKLIGECEQLGIRLFKKSKYYICIFTKPDNNTTEGEAIEAMQEWFMLADQVIAFQSLTLIPNYLTEAPGALKSDIVRMLDSDYGKNGQGSRMSVPLVPYLERPNLVTGRTAAGATFRECLQKPWQLYVWYHESNLGNGDLDFEPFLNTIKALQIPYKAFKQNIFANVHGKMHSSLYM